MKRSSLIILVLALVTAGLRPAYAQDADAKTLFAEGRRLREAGKCAEAIDAFRRALEAWPEGIGSLRNIAQCEEELGRYASARRSWWDLRREALKSDEPKYDDWEHDAEAAHKRLEPLVPMLTVKLEGAAPSQVRVLVDGETLEEELVGVALERDVGEHRIEVWHQGKVIAKERILLDARQREVITLSVTLPASAEPKPNGKPGPAHPNPQPNPRNPRKGDSGDTDGLLVAGIAFASVGVLSGVGAIIAGVIRGQAITDLEEGCIVYPTNCPPQMIDTLDRGRTATDLVNVFAVIGAVSAAAGVGLIVAGVATDEEEPTRGAWITFGPGSVAAGISF